MEAKDTVIPTTEENCHNTLEERLLEQAKVSFNAGARHGIRLYAWWQDGVQFVGTTGRTLKDALLEYEEVRGKDSTRK